LWPIDRQLRNGDGIDETMEPQNVRAFDQHNGHDHLRFAGNAAHGIPIVGVHGTNSGLVDADRWLAWKPAGAAIVRTAGRRGLGRHRHRRRAEEPA
jgi:2-polyprenyl-6-methoxyphenol hydroxylase-like FAD-dependent oxidoreductase